jgi:hypothetical protein
MLLFSVCPPHYRRILFALKHMRNEVSLARYYIKRNGHLIGPQIEVWEFDLAEKTAERFLQPMSWRKDRLGGQHPAIRAFREPSGAMASEFEREPSECTPWPPIRPAVPSGI